MSMRVGDPIGHAWLASFATTPVLRRREERLLAQARGEVLRLDRVGLAALRAQGSGSIDTVVSVLSLCSVPDLDRVLASIRRVLRSDGQFLFLEHVPDWFGSRRPYDVVGPTWRRLGGCDPTRDVPGAVRRAGFNLGDLERFEVNTVAVPLRTFAVGRAKPGRWE